MDDRNGRIALYIDFENLARGFTRSSREEFDIKRVMDRLVEKGKVVMKRAYCDWSRFGKFKDALHEAGIELVEIPRRSVTGKNSADIRLVVDVMDMCYAKEHIGTFVIASGDSDFSPLVSKLKENGKHVIGLGMKGSTSNLLAENCDEFIFYEDLQTDGSGTPKVESGVSKEKKDAFDLLFESIEALQRENVTILWSSIVKETMKRKRPSFAEGAHGYRNFSSLLEDARKGGYIQLRKDERSGSYIIVGFGRERSNGDEVEVRESAPKSPKSTVAAPKRQKAPKRTTSPKRAASPKRSTIGGMRRPQRKKLEAKKIEVGDKKSIKPTS
jgi:uncharacterized protein (TIGR00288 family)